MNRISVKGVVVGGIVDVVATMLCTLIAVIFLVNRLLAHGGPATGGPIIAPPPATHAVLVVVAGVCSLFGGYVAARIAKHDELLNGALSAYLAILVGLILLPFDKSPAAVRNVLISVVTSIVLGLLGGYVRSLQTYVGLLRNDQASDA
jgi:putative membrane protein (TIGR04086 family)